MFLVSVPQPISAFGILRPPTVLDKSTPVAPETTGMLIKSVIRLGIVLAITLSALVNTVSKPLGQAQRQIPAQKGSGGVYRVTAHGKPAGMEHFETVTSGDQVTLTSSDVIGSGEAEQKINSSLEVHRGKPFQYIVETGSGLATQKYTLTFGEGGAKAKIESTGRTAERAIKLRDDVVILDKDVWCQYRLLFSKYDMAKKGVQSFQVFTPVPALRAYTVEVEVDQPATFGSGSERFPVNKFYVRLAEGVGLIALVSLDGTPVEFELPTQDTKIVLQ
jgi:hypothetical protein